MTQQEAEALVATLQASFAGATDELCVDGWVFEAVTSRYLMQRHLPVVTFRRGTDSLCFIVTATDATAQVFRHGARFDVTYFSEDVPDAQQSKIYRRDKPQIERVAGWVCRLG